MELRATVTARLQEAGLHPYPGNYLILDKYTITTIYHKIYNDVIDNSTLKDIELMKAIDNENESH